MKSVDAVNGLPHTIDCTNIYEDVLDLYREGSVAVNTPSLSSMWEKRELTRGGAEGHVFIILGKKRILCYRRLGFNCEYVLIANCEFFYVSQLMDSQTNMHVYYSTVQGRP